MQQTHRVRVTIRKSFAHRTGAPVSLSGVILAETPRAIRVSGHATCEDAVCCARCGRDLSDPVSRLIGVGPECCAHWHISRPSSEKAFTHADVEALRAAVREVTWSGWVPLSCAIVTPLEAAPVNEALVEQRIAANKAAAPVIPAHGVVIALTPHEIVVRGARDLPFPVAAQHWSTEAGEWRLPRTSRVAYDLVRAYPKAQVDPDVYKAAAAWQKRLALQEQPVAAV